MGFIFVADSMGLSSFVIAVVAPSIY